MRNLGYPTRKSEESNMAAFTGLNLCCCCCVLFFLNLNGCGMGPLLVHVSRCFRENVVVTCKIGSFLCSLDNLLQKNVIVCLFVCLFFFLKSNFKMALI